MYIPLKTRLKSQKECIILEKLDINKEKALQLLKSSSGMARDFKLFLQLGL